MGVLFLGVLTLGVSKIRCFETLDVLFLGVLKIRCFDTLDVLFLGFLTIGVLKIRYFEVKLAAIDSIQDQPLHPMYLSRTLHLRQG